MKTSNPTPAQVSAFEYRVYIAGLLNEVRRLCKLIDGIAFSDGAQDETYKNISEDLSICSAAVLRAHELQTLRDELRKQEQEGASSDERSV